MSSSAPSVQSQAHGRLTGWLLAVVAALAAGLLAWTLVGMPSFSPDAALPRPAKPAATPAVVQRPPPANPEPAASAPQTTVAAGPSFDIVRVGPRGDAVRAGRSKPGAQVVVADNGHGIAQAQADAQGQWVALPTAPLTMGGHQLTLTAATTDKPHAVASRGVEPVIVVVPPPGGSGASGPLALLAPEAGMPRLLQAPQSALSAGQVAGAPVLPLPAGSPIPRLGIGLVDYDAHGAILFAGTASPGAAVRLYIDRHPMGDARADAQGHWMLQPAASTGAGRHQLRLDQLAGNGTVAARMALPFDRALLPEGAVLDGKVVVQPGQSLWRIARHVYGRGIRYTVIYLANRGQIRNPALIYPGQIFAVPSPAEASPPKPSPASSSAAR
jgi:nucleoid-associated protein YgaU